MNFKNKEVNFKQKLEPKKLMKYVAASVLGVGAIAVGSIFFFGDSDNNNQENAIDYSGKLRYDNSSKDNDDKIKSLIGDKVNASDPYSSIVDPTLSSVIAGNPVSQQSSGVDLGDIKQPLYSSDDKYAYKDNFDYDHATASQLKAKIAEEEGKKMIKVGEYTTLVDDPSDNWRQNSNGANNLNNQNNIGSKNPVSNSFPLLYDKNNKQIFGYDENGNPIVGYDANGKPILGTPLPKGVAGYDANGNIVSKVDFAKNLGVSENPDKTNFYDKNGKLILGYDKNGNPIVGYDSNGKPILGKVDKGVTAYDSNGNPISNAKDLLYKQSGIKLLDKNGKSILGYDANGNPIVGYDSNGKPILGKVDKGVAGYDSNGNAISEAALKTIGVQKNLLNNLDSTTKLFDKDGKSILGYDANGNPIVGYDSNGKPILGKVDKGVAGYDANRNPITKDQLQSYLKNNATESAIAKTNKPPLYDKSGNLILGYDSKGNPIIGYDASGKPILGKVDKGVAGYDSNGNPILKSQLQEYYKNNNIGNKGGFNALDSVAGAGLFNGSNSSVPPVSGFQPGDKQVSIQPQNSGVNVEQKNLFNNMQQTESKPWSEALAKTDPDADKAGVSLSLSYKDNESKDSGSSSNPQNKNSNLNPQNNTNTIVENDDNKDKTEKITPVLPIKAYNKFTVKAGSFIPMIMQTGINSDLPGMIIGKVSQNVYDTATGKYLLIPQGSQLLGSYSSNITYGQERVLVAWNSIIYPDASEMKISGQPGTDLQGFSGLNDQVNNHYWTLFGNTFLLSVLTAGLEYNQQGSANSANNGSSFSASLSNSSGQMMGQAAAGVIQKALNISPTLIIRNGMRGNVILTQDLALPSPYKVNIYNGGENINH